LALVWTALAVVYPWIIFRILKEGQPRLEEKAFKQKFGGLYQVFKTDSPLALNFTVVKLVRKLTFGLAIYHLQSIPVLQMGIIAISQMSYLRLLMKAKPYKSQTRNKQALFSEGFFTAALTLMTLFPLLGDAMGISFYKYTGWLCTLLLTLTSICNVLFLLYNTFRSRPRVGDSEGEAYDSNDWSVSDLEKQIAKGGENAKNGKKGGYYGGYSKEVKAKS
jgi:hypothetical protein